MQLQEAPVIQKPPVIYKSGKQQYPANNKNMFILTEYLRDDNPSEDKNIFSQIMFTFLIKIKQN